MGILFSIIIPTFNSEQTLNGALDSIAAQTFEHYEVLCMDGQSTDGTISLATKYSQNDNRVQLYSEKDYGIYDAMNKGIVLATGEWLLFLGSDDCLYDRNVLADVARVLEKTTARLVYGDAVLLSDKHRYGGKFDVMRLHTEANLCHQTMFYHHEVFEKVGLYNLKYPVLSDWELNIRCFRHPGIETKYLARDIVLFNNVSGVSSQPYDDPLYRELPVRYLQELKEYKSNRVINSPIYTAARTIYKRVKSMF